MRLTAAANANELVTQLYNYGKVLAVISFLIRATVPEPTPSSVGAMAQSW